MQLSPTTLKVVGALGTLTVAGTAAATVAADQRPGGAPLTPPLTSGANAAVPASPAGAEPALSIPTTPVCQPGGRGGAAARRGAGATAVGSVDPAVAQVVQQLRRTPAGVARQTYLEQAMASLTADQRQQLTALLQTALQAAQGARAGGGRSAGCRGTDSTSSGSTGQGGIDPSVVTAPSDQAPVTASAVS